MLLQWNPRHGRVPGTPKYTLCHVVAIAQPALADVLQASAPHSFRSQQKRSAEPGNAMAPRQWLGLGYPRGFHSRDLLLPRSVHSESGSQQVARSQPRAKDNRRTALRSQKRSLYRDSCQSAALQPGPSQSSFNISHPPTQLVETLPVNKSVRRSSRDGT
ncbi:hypothetical protein CABS01_16389 [Colletotrichum abscissum]|uniref:uncharacterized protein n=1 Tax=Colletotrichum abscissum TaxID=1671311 RepID=UPI0027D5CD74|nr:uncharacterized protein CABS01_16389 [Colletotrichum abscissum]KAK1471303.1 hypothetical protein CABS01_16389 [Colletotrichum abscissum]